jgi:hypothetical protein
MGAISSVNVLGNSIGVEHAQELITILQAKEKLITLCGFSGDETELDLSNKNLSAGCAVLVANEIINNGALSSLNLASNSICNVSDWMKPPRESLKVGDLVDGNPVVEIYSDGDIKIMYISGIIALANAIKDMGALSSLNLASNSIGGYLKYGSFNATPEGRVSYSFCKSSRQLLSFSLFSRPSRYR